MGNDSTTSAIVGQAAATMGQIAVNAAANRRQYKNQVKAMNLQAQMNKDAWDYQNAYNTPQAQMERLQAAGLNPHLIYGSGAASGGMASPMAVPDAPVKEVVRPEIGDPLLRYLQVRQMDAQYAATTQNVEMMKKRSALTDIQTALATLKTMEQGARSKNFRDLADVELSTKRFLKMRANALQQNEYTKGEVMDQLQDLRGKQMTNYDLDITFKRYRNDLAKLGIYSSDAPAMRILIQASKRMGIDLGELLAKGAKELKYLLE